MASNNLNFEFEVQGKYVNGCFMRIQDDVHETYAVIMEGYHSFCVWLDKPSSTWRFSKHINVEPGIVEKIISHLKAHQMA